MLSRLNLLERVLFSSSKFIESRAVSVDLLKQFVCLIEGSGPLGRVIDRLVCRS